MSNLSDRLKNILDLLKFGQKSIPIVIAIWVSIFGAAGGIVHVVTQKPVEKAKIPLPIPEPVNVITLPKPVPQPNCKQICGDLITEHEKKFHFR